MKKITQFLICVLVFSAGIVFSDDSAKVTWYSGGEDVIKLSPIPKTVSWFLPVKGTTTWPVLMLQIQNLKTGNKKSIKINTDSNSFDSRIILKDGPGNYDVIVFGSKLNNESYAGLCDVAITVASNPPSNLNLDLNSQLLEFADKQMGKTVGRGECWDLIQAGLDSLGADWQRPTSFGKPLNFGKDTIKPGDVVQMYSLTIKYSNRTEYFGLPLHTAIIHKVLGPNRFELINQNVSGKRYVVLTDFRAGNVVSGRMEFYRPQAGFYK